MSNRTYLFDLHDIIDNLKDDLEECGELIRLPYSEAEMTYESLLDKLEQTNEIHGRDVQMLEDLLEELAKEFVFYRLMYKYLSIPKAYGALYLELLDKLFVGSIVPHHLTKRERQVRSNYDRAVAIGTVTFTYTEAFIDKQLNIMPVDEWTMIDFDVQGSVIKVTAGMNFKEFFFDAINGTGRWTGEYIPAGSSKSKLTEKHGREVTDNIIFDTVSQSVSGSRRRRKKEASSTRMGVEAAIDGLTS